MQPYCCFRWLFPWVPLGIIVVLLGTLIGLCVVAPGPAPAASPAIESAAAFQTTDNLVLTVNLPRLTRDDTSLRVEIRDADGNAVAGEHRLLKASEGESGQRFEFAAPKGGADKLTLHCKLGDNEYKTPLSKVLLVKAHETALSAGQEYFAGSDASLRCEVHGVKSLTETVPLSAAVSVRLVPEKGGEAVKLFDGKTGPRGVADVRFKMPAKPAGSYKLEVVTKSSLGEEKLEQPIKLKSAPRVLLVSDKPLYQPGQVIHLRALALKANDLAPVAGSDITFEVEDAKGNKVFKKALKTSDYGIASADFQLADEVNNGDYRLRAILGDHTADKTVTVKPYVLPKFKSQLTADKPFYLPKETVKTTLQTDYLFGKPVAKAKVKVTASTFDVAFREFHTWEGKTDDNGHVSFDIKLPDYFVGQPLSKGNAVVRLEAKITDGAGHSETVGKTLPVSDQPVRVSLIPEGGRVVPGMENRVFAAAIYPDGSPAACEVKLWIGQKADGKPFATLKTNAAGLAEFRLTPKPEQFRAGGWGQRNVETLGGKTQEVWGPQSYFDLCCEASDGKGSKASAVAQLTSEPLGENVVLRLDKAIYKGGESIKLDILTSAGMPTAYLDVVRGGQTMLTKWLDVKDGKASDRLDLPESVFGTLEVHAYQMLASGEVIRDSRVVYVQPASDLHIDVKPDAKEYRPGQEGKITFRVTDKDGKPTAAALGVLIVDEAVYALQDMQPGLEKVYFTLQEELLKPQAQVLYRPSEPLDSIVRREEVPVDKQQIAEVLLTSVKPKAPARWEVNPVIDRQRKMEAIVLSVKQALYDQGLNGRFVVYDTKTKTHAFAKDALKELSKLYGWTDKQLTDPMGGKVTLDSLAKVDPSLSPERFAHAVTQYRIHQLTWNFAQYAQQRQKDWLKDGKWSLPKDALEQFAKAHRWGKDQMNDVWGHPLVLVKLDKKRDHQTGWPVLDFHEIVSAGPDGKLGTDDDVKMGSLNDWQRAYVYWMGGHSARQNDNLDQMILRGHRGLRGAVEEATLLRLADAPGLPMPAKGAPGAGRFDERAKDRAPGVKFDGKEDKAGDAKTAGQDDKGGGGGAAPPKVREFFPETMLWRPSLITNDRGEAVLPVPFADSITTWRLTASASSRNGLLGGTTAPLRVFQDFFVDLDLPLNLTRNDEVAFPIAVYNYLKTSQKVTLTLKGEDWFELTDAGGLTRTVEVKAGEVAGVHFRIKARRIGRFPLEVEARGDKLSDAVKRYIEVVPDGRKVEQVLNDRLTGRAVKSVVIPDGALPDASKLFVKVYPGVFSQLLEGTEGILRMPGGCFEQTSSSAYPNILVVDYIKKNKLASPAILMKAEQYLNAGYQRLLTFEHKAGGFDWWGQEANPPLVWLSAYGLMEFNDMARVMPIDRGVIKRTQDWLMRQQDADGTWSKIGATHSVSIERMGDPKLLLTSYVTWALLESGYKDDRLKKSIEYIRKEAPKADNAYILAMAANALASWDAKDDSTHEILVKVLRKLDDKKQETVIDKERVVCFPAGGGQSLTYARGDYLTVETTAMAVLAMLKNGQFGERCTQALTYLIKSKDPHGTWGSTQATILALKALVNASGGMAQKGEATFSILVNGKEAATGVVNEKNSDVMQAFDLSEHLKAGANEVVLEVKGETNLMYQVVGRHFEAWANKEEAKPLFDVAVEYDRTKLSTKDLLKAKATLKYNGKEPTSMVMLDLGIAPGFTADAGDFAEMVAAKKVNKFSVTSRQVILYLGDVKPGEVLTFEYTLRPKYPIKAKTPPSVAYEYYTPANRGTAKPVELVVEEKK